MPQVMNPDENKTRRHLDRAKCRVWERFPCDLESSCQPLAARAGGTEPWPGRIQDISPGGVALVLRRRFEPGAGLAIEVPVAGSDTLVPLLARVVHATRMTEGRWLLGCSFPSPLGEEELQNLLGYAPATPEAPPPQGQAVAASPVSAAAKDLVLPRIIFEGSTAEGEAVRLRVRNLFLKGAWPLKAGKVLRVWVGDRATYPQGVKLRVNACVEQGDRWIVKYSFVAPPPPDLLRLFSEPRV